MVEIRELTIKMNVGPEIPTAPDMNQMEANMNKLKQEIEAELTKLKATNRQQPVFER